MINGLPILSGTDETAYELDAYYRDNVIVGPGAFIEIAQSYEDFEQAFRRKLLRELTPVVSRNEAPPEDQVEKSPAVSGRSGRRRRNGRRPRPPPACPSPCAP